MVPPLVDNDRRSYYNDFMSICHELPVRRVAVMLVMGMVLFFCGLEQSARAQTVSSVRGFDGGVAPLFTLTGPGNLYLDQQGTQGYI